MKTSFVTGALVFNGSILVLLGRSEKIRATVLK